MEELYFCIAFVASVIVALGGGHEVAKNEKAGQSTFVSFDIGGSMFLATKGFLGIIGSVSSIDSCLFFYGVTSLAVFLREIKPEDRT